MMELLQRELKFIMGPDMQVYKIFSIYSVSKVDTLVLFSVIYYSKQDSEKIISICNAAAYCSEPIELDDISNPRHTFRFAAHNSITPLSANDQPWSDFAVNNCTYSTWFAMFNRQIQHSVFFDFDCNEMQTTDTITKLINKYMSPVSSLLSVNLLQTDKSLSVDSDETQQFLDDLLRKFEGKITKSKEK